MTPTWRGFNDLNRGGRKGNIARDINARAGNRTPVPPMENSISSKRSSSYLVDHTSYFLMRGKCVLCTQPSSYISAGTSRRTRKGLTSDPTLSTPLDLPCPALQYVIPTSRSESAGRPRPRDCTAPLSDIPDRFIIGRGNHGDVDPSGRFLEGSARAHWR
jgi:hypothetical protein